MKKPEEADLKLGVLPGYPRSMQTSFGLIVSQGCWEKYALSADPMLPKAVPAGHERVRILGTRFDNFNELPGEPAWEPNCSVIRRWASVSNVRFNPYRLTALEHLIHHQLATYFGCEQYLQEVSFELRIIRDLIAGDKPSKCVEPLLKYYDFFEEIIQ